MKPILLMLSLAALLTGCTMTRDAARTKGGPATDPSNLALERKVAERLPLVTAESVTPQNHLAKANELAEELNRDAHRLDSARNVASADK